jgi:hypothetical protein
MNRPIVIDGNVVEAHVEYVTEPDLAFLDQWKRSLGKDNHPKRVDAVDFATLACKRYKSYAEIETYATRLADIADYVRDNPHAEVANFVVLRCNAFTPSNVMGLAHFRRSWCNNLILDYLVSHPWIASPPAGYDMAVNGVGLALMYFLCATAIQQKSDAIWGEATQNSCEYYQKVFKLDSVRDLLYIPFENLVAFVKGQDQKWNTRE